MVTELGLNIAKRSDRLDPFAVYWKHDFRPLCRRWIWNELD